MKAPSKNVVLLFCGSIVISVLLIIGATTYGCGTGITVSPRRTIR